MRCEVLLNIDLQLKLSPLSLRIDSAASEHVKMADDEKEETIVEENLALESCGDVFVNGEANGDTACRAEDEEEEEEEEEQNGISDNLPESVLPRRSSLMKKDAASRRPKRKKTVSFSSMDKKIATGKKCILSVNVYRHLCAVHTLCHSGCSVKNGCNHLGHCIPFSF